MRVLHQRIPTVREGRRCVAAAAGAVVAHGRPHVAGANNPRVDRDPNRRSPGDSLEWRVTARLNRRPTQWFHRLFLGLSQTCSNTVSRY